MALEYCLPAVGMGSVADWATVAVAVWAAVIAAVAVVVGVAGTAATVWVALLAHRTSRRATEIAEDATKIAAQQHQEAVQLREANARILGRQLLYEVTALPARVSALINQWEKAVALEPPKRIVNGQLFQETLEEAKLALLPGAQRLEDRIHNLPDHLGADLATLIGGSQTLSEIVRKIQGRYFQPTSLSGWGYNGNPEDFSHFHGQLLWLKDLSTGFAEEFRAFAVTDEPVPPNTVIDQ